MFTAEYLLQSVNEAIAGENFQREPQELYEPISYIFSLGGKRIRPVMLLMAADMFGGDIREAMPAALSIEIFHNFSLIHDDIMDHAPLRRGNQTVHERWNANTAILSGDTMMVKAYDQFLKLPERLVRPLLVVFNMTATGVCEGQQLDMNFELLEEVSIPAYMEMIRLKTAVLIGAALKMGGMVAGAPDEDLEQLYNFGIQTGLQFQLTDDLLDTYGNTETFGKKLYGDIVSGKKTFLYLMALEHSSGNDRTRLMKLYADRQSDPAARVKKVLKYFEVAEVKKQTEDKIRELYVRAQESFEAIRLPREKKTILEKYTKRLTGRSF